MGQAKQQRQQDCRRPEAHSSSKRELKVSAESKFLPKANHHESRGPCRSRCQDGLAVNRKASEVKSVKSPDGKQAAADCQEPDQSSQPEILAHRKSHRQA